MTAVRMTLDERIERLHESPWEYYVSPFRIYGNLYFAGNADVGAYLLKTEAGPVLIDTAYPQTYSLLEKALEELDTVPEDIVAILHTHGHFDHIGGTLRLKERSGAVTCLSRADAEMFRQQPELSLRDQNRTPQLKLFVPDMELKDGQKLCFGSTCITCISTPGHSAGVMSFLIRLQEGGRELTAGLYGGAGLNTLKNSHALCYHLDGEYMRRMRELYPLSLKKAAAYPVDINLGNHTDQNHTLEKRHRMLAGEEGNPFLCPGEWKKMLKEFQSRYEQLKAENWESV